VPRPPRVQFAGAVYHLMNRGVRGEDLYTDARGHRHFLALLAETCIRYEWLIGAYCLMGNHYHLLVTTPEPTLSAGMQWRNSCYA
jgi:putative transposase